MDARGFFRLSLLVAGIVLSALVAPMSLIRVHAVGNLYIDPAGQAAQPAGSIVTYQVKVTNMDPFNGWDIRVSTTRLSLDPVNLTLASSVGGSPLFELVNCVNGGEGIPAGQPGSVGCNIQDGPGIVHSVADFQNLSPSGINVLLFTMKFRAGSQDYGQVRFLDSIMVGAGVAVIHTSTEGSYGTLPGGIPIAEFSWRPVHPVAGDTISFNASLSHDDPSNSPSGIQDYQWDFGDGSLATSTKTPYVDHGFSSISGFGLIGNFTVTLTVTNQLGLLGAAAHIVEVKLRPPPPPLCKVGLSSINVPNDCPTIKSAIDSIVPGGTIQVTRGSYNESLIVNKSLTLTGAGRDLTILRGEIESRAANVTLSAFTLIGSGDYFDPFRAVLNVQSPANTVSDVRVEGPVNIMDSPGTVMTSSIVDNSPLVYGLHLGLRIVNSANSIFRSNRFSELSISGENPKDYFLDMDQSNTVNGKPVFYALGVDNPRVPSQPGYLGFVDSSDIRISHMSMTMVGQGVLLVSTRHVVIDDLQVTDAVDVVHTLNATDTVIENNRIDGATFAIFNSSVTSIIDNTMTGGGIEIVGSNSSLVARNKISSPSNNYAYLSGSFLPLFDVGIAIIRSDNNRFEDNLVSNARLGILLSDSSLNQLLENRIDIIPPFFFPTSGLIIQNSPQNLLRNNSLTRLMTSLSVTSNHLGDCSSRYQCHVIQDYVQDIDTSNTVDDQPIFYLVSRRDMTIPSSAAYIGIVNSENIKVPHANLSSSVDGILVVSSKNVMIENANLTIGNYGVWAWKTEAITISDSKIQIAIQADGLFLESTAGIYTEDSSQAKVSGNMITRWGIFTGIDMVNTTSSLVEGNFISHYLLAGIRLEHSTLNMVSRNTLIGTPAFDDIGILDMADFNPVGGVIGKPDHNLFVGNTITTNRVGMAPGVGSIIYSNNFIDNLFQSGDANPPNNKWDNSAGQGNYWSDYKGQDLDHDGVGDTLVPHLGIDRYPLMTPWTSTGLAASFMGRGAWFGQTNPDNSDDHHHDQSLLARVRNNAQTSEWVDIVYSITSSTGSTMTIDTGPVWLAKGQSAILSTSFQGPPGAYTVKAELRFSSDAFLGWTNATTKNFMFKVNDEKTS